MGLRGFDDRAVPRILGIPARGGRLTRAHVELGILKLANRDLGQADEREGAAGTVKRGGRLQQDAEVVKGADGRLQMVLEHVGRPGTGWRLLVRCASQTDDESAIAITKGGWLFAENLARGCGQVRSKRDAHRS